MIHPDVLAAELAALQAARLRRIAARRQARAEHAERRRHGLAARHAAKLARIEARLAEARRDGPADSWWEDPL